MTLKLWLRAGRVMLLLSLLTGSLGAARTTITFWHSMESSEQAVLTLAESFNAAQDEYHVDARYIGSYNDAQTRLVAALGTPTQPTLFQAEIAFFPRLAEEGAAQDLSDLVATLEGAFIDDFYPGLWSYGEMHGGRYGLPWNSSTPVLFYNATALRQHGVEVPTTWEEFKEAVGLLTSRRAQGLVFVTDSWLFELMVTTRGGRLVGADGNPNFTSPEAIEALEMLKRLADRRQLAVYAPADTTPAMLGFIRTRTLMAFASIANWPDVHRFAIAFDIGAAPVPTGGSPAVPLGGAQLVVMRGAGEAERQGAFEFWRFLMEPENIAEWVRASYYIPLRRAALPLLQDWYQEDPNRGAALEQLEHAVPRPRVGEFSTWRRYLDEALERALRGGTGAEAALAEAQRRAMEDVR